MIFRRQCLVIGINIRSDFVMSKFVGLTLRLVSEACIIKLNRKKIKGRGGEALVS
jgi:hypothetical protein